MKTIIRKICALLIFCLLLSLVSCAPFKKSEVLCDYKEMNCLYYTKDEYKRFKYSDFVVDDVTNGGYKKSTPNIADYRTGNGILDYDIPAYVDAKMSFEIKKQLLEKYETKIDSICQQVRDDYFEQKNSYIYFYDKNTKESKLLYDGPVTNISYDDETPMVTFDVDEIKDKVTVESLKGRKIKLSDIIAANTTLDGFMKVILGTGKTRMKFFMDRRLDK